jgi:SAM-dependent methyltransferase
VVVHQAGRELVRLTVDMPVQIPHYSALFDEQRVLHRESIYGYGPPAAEPNPDLVELVLSLPTPVLDLGCGSGALVRVLRRQGIEAHGIELRRPETLASLGEDVKEWVTVYDGQFPLPFPDQRFRSVVCSEVLEHIPEHAAAIREIARVAQEALITVPDMSAIPALFPHNVVPWHLLEATHVNFFTQASLGAALGSAFRSVSFSRLGRFEINGTPVFTSLVARCKA